MNLLTLRAKLTRVERQRLKLEQQIQKGSKKQLDALPARVGLKTIDELILELLPHASPRIRSQVESNGAAAPSTGRRPVGRPRKDASAAPAPKSTGGAAKSKGVRYTDDTKQAIKEALEAGGMTVSAISEKFGASPFSINQWKKRWGLTKVRKKK
jgi:hypothetical protein